VILKAREVISIRGSRINIGKLKEMVKAEKGEIICFEPQNSRTRNRRISK
jgi:hypothetical protein